MRTASRIETRRNASTDSICEMTSSASRSLCLSRNLCGLQYPPAGRNEIRFSINSTKSNKFFNNTERRVIYAGPMECGIFSIWKIGKKLQSGRKRKKKTAREREREREREKRYSLRCLNEVAVYEKCMDCNGTSSVQCRSRMRVRACARVHLFFPSRFFRTRISRA